MSSELSMEMADLETGATTEEDLDVDDVTEHQLLRQENDGDINNGEKNVTTVSSDLQRDNTTTDVSCRPLRVEADPALVRTEAVFPGAYAVGGVDAEFANDDYTLTPSVASTSIHNNPARTMTGQHLEQPITARLVQNSEQDYESLQRELAHIRRQQENVTVAQVTNQMPRRKRNVLIGLGAFALVGMIVGIVMAVVATSSDTTTNAGNNCDPNPCQNDGVCVDGVNDFACACAPGYHGVRCNCIGGFSQLGSDIDGEVAQDRSGESVSLSNDGSTLAVGAPFNRDNDGNRVGHVRVYKWNMSAWTQLGRDIDGEAEYDRSGRSVSLSSDGSNLAVGAPHNDDNGSNSGHVRVYKWDESTWTQLGRDIHGETANTEFGTSVSLSDDGSTLAAGAIYNNGTGSSSGHVQVYKWIGGTWSQLGSDIDGEVAYDQSGRSVSLSSDGSTLAVGAPYNDENGSNSGHVRVFKWNTSAWTRLGSDIDGSSANDQSGIAVSLSGDGSMLAIGAPLNGPGHVRVYKWTGRVWDQHGNDISGEANGDLSGTFLSLSSDGSTLAIGAPRNGGNGSFSGHVRIYKWNGTTWTQLGSDIDGEAAGDESGEVVLSSDGNTLAVGAYLNDGNGELSGHVRVYNLTSSCS